MYIQQELQRYSYHCTNRVIAASCQKRKVRIVVLGVFLCQQASDLVSGVFYNGNENENEKFYF